MAGNNRGVAYVTVGGAETGVRSYSTSNPTGTHLTGIRELKAAAELVTKANSSPATRAPSSDLVIQLERLAELHSAGVLTDNELTTKKAELLDRL